MKRTLTNEQIAIFRHSEIYSLLRERQLLKENSESIDYAQSNKALFSEFGGARATTINVHEVNCQRINDHESNEEEEYTRFLEAESNNNNNNNNNDDDEEGQSTKFIENERENMKTRNVLGKRKIGKVDGYVSNDRPSTHRRIARELDNAIAHDDILDYGEEPSGSKDIPKNTAGDELENRPELDKAEPTDSLAIARSDVKSSGSVSSSNKHAIASSSKLGENQYKAVYDALMDWRERVGPDKTLEPTSAEGPDTELLLSHTCIQEIAESASSLHSTEDFDIAAVHWDKELVTKNADELTSVITKALADFKKPPMQGKKIWWPIIGK